MGMLDEYLWRDILDYETEKAERLDALGRALELSPDKEYTISLYEQAFSTLSEDDWDWLINHYSISK